MPNEPPAAPSVPIDPAASPLAAQLSPAERSRLSQCFQRGTQNAPTNVDYAIEMFSLCVLGDPGNAVYLQSLLTALRRKYGPKKAGGLGAFWPGSRAGSLKKLAATAQWREIIKQGVAILKATPSDYGCLLEESNEGNNQSA
ncbi:MAG: hypothetical protein WCJ18_08060, partial [Planctomycetota bacterium]